MMSQKFQIFAVVALCFIESACGGAGTGTSASNAPPLSVVPAPPVTTVSATSTLAPPFGTATPPDTNDAKLDPPFVLDYLKLAPPAPSPLPVPAGGTVIYGAATLGPDGRGATVSLFNADVAGAPVGGALATTVSGNAGTYSMVLGQRPAGPVVLTATGGTYLSAADSGMHAQPPLATLLASVADGASYANLTLFTTFVQATAHQRLLDSPGDIASTLPRAQSAVEWGLGLFAFNPYEASTLANEYCKVNTVAGWVTAITPAMDLLGIYYPGSYGAQTAYYPDLINSLAALPQISRTSYDSITLRTNGGWALLVAQFGLRGALNDWRVTAPTVSTTAVPFPPPVNGHVVSIHPGNLCY